MGKSDAISDVGIGTPKDMRHAEGVARDADVGGLERRRRLRSGGQRLPDGEGYGGKDEQRQDTHQNLYTTSCRSSRPLPEQLWTLERASCRARGCQYGLKPGGEVH